MASINKNVYIDCMNVVPVASLSTGGAASGGNTTVTNVAAGPHSLEIYNTQDNADIVPTRVIDANTTNGWQIPSDNADNNGAELTFGILADANRVGAFKVGTDPAFFFEVKFGVPVVADYDFLGIGFRKAAAYGVINDEGADFGTAVVYTDCAAIYSDNGDIKTSVFINQTGGGTGTGTITDTTDNWANDEVKSLRVNVSAAGVATFLINGAAPTAGTHTVTFDDTDIVIPFMNWVKDAIGTDTPPIIEYIKCGLQ